MARRVATLYELKGHTLEGVLHEVAESDEAFTFVLGEEAAVVISPEAYSKGFTGIRRANTGSQRLRPDFNN